MNMKKYDLIFLGYASPWKTNTPGIARLERSNNFRPIWDLYAPSFEPGDVFRKKNYYEPVGEFDYIYVVGDPEPEGYGVEVYSYMGPKEEIRRFLETGRFEEWEKVEKPNMVRLVHTPPIVLMMQG